MVVKSVVVLYEVDNPPVGVVDSEPDGTGADSEPDGAPVDSDGTPVDSAPDGADSEPDGTGADSEPDGAPVDSDGVDSEVDDVEEIVSTDVNGQ